MAVPSLSHIGKHRLRLITSSIVLLFLIWSAQTQVVQAEDITLDGSCAVGGANGLATVISNTNSNDEDDTINLNGSCTYTLSATLFITNDNNHTLTINGNGATISGGGAVQVFNIASGANVALNGLTITGGSAVEGGGIYNTGTLTITNSTFSGNLTTINNNGGGGIYNTGTLTVSDTTFSDNRSTNQGGGIYNTGTLTVSDSTFSDNRSTNDGGGIYNTGTLTVSDTTFSGNSTRSHGGGIYNTGTLTVSDTTFSGNAAFQESGGGIFNDGTLTVSDSTFSANRADPFGAGIHNFGGMAMISSSSFSNNEGRFGGGITVTAGTVNIINSTFSANTGIISGGGIYHEGGGTTIINSTFSGNLTTINLNGGGGIGVRAGTVNIINSTLSDNSAVAGGGIWNDGGMVNIGNSIVANSPNGGDCVGTINHTGPNYGCSGSVMGDLSLGPFNGVYFPLEPDSVAIDAGDNTLIPTGVTTDQAGNPRIRGSTVDLGAYESEYTFPMLRINDVALNEGNSGDPTLINFAISLSKPAGSGGVTFNIATADGTATTGDGDYVASSVSGSIAQGSSGPYLFAVPVNRDTKFEDNETFFVNVTIVDGAVAGDTQAVGTILNDDAQPSLTIDDVTQAEGNGGTTDFTFTVTMSNPSYQDVSVDVDTADNTATVLDGDYNAVSTSLTFPADTTTLTQTVTVQVNGDQTVEVDEAFVVNLSNPINATIADEGMGTILNDDATAGITVTPTTGLLTTEAGGTATFNIRLNSQPTEDVTIDLISSDTTEGTVPASVTIPVASWQTGVDLMVTGVDDALADGSIGYTIQTGASSSNDPNYAGIDPDDVSVTNQDDDTPGVTVNPTTGLLTTEAGGTATFDVVLNSQPTADVTINLTSSDTSEGTVPASITFTDADWNVTQTVTVTGADDAVVDGDIAYTIVASMNSTDPDYAAIDPADVDVTNQDDDTVEVIITPTSLNGTEGSSLSYQIRLGSVPSGAVTVQISFDPAQVNVNGSAVSPVTLTMSDNAPQTVIVLVVQNPNENGDRTTLISHAIVSSAAPEYPVGMALPDVTVTIGDVPPTATVPPPPPTPLCEDHNFADGGVVRASISDALGYAVNCRVLYQNGQPTQWLGGDLYNAGAIGIQGVLDLGVLQAIDIFSPVGRNYFEGGAVFCLRGQGTLIWLAAKNAPRVAEIIGSYTVDDFIGFTCATLFEPGTLVLVRDSSVQPAPPPPPPAEPQSETLTNCTVTTQYVTLPGTPRGTLVELTATAYVDGGYEVLVNGLELWISADLVTPNGDCGG